MGAGTLSHQHHFVPRSHPSHLPVGPIREALHAHLRRTPLHDMARRWSFITGRNFKSCHRSITRILYTNQYALVDHVDELCLYVLGTHPLLVYGEDWGKVK